MKSFHSAVILSLLSLMGLYSLSSAQAQLPDGRDRTAFVNGFIPDCVKSAKESAVTSKLFSDEQTQRYCECAAKETADMISIDDLVSLVRAGMVPGGIPPDDVMKKLTDAGKVCLGRILNSN